MLPESTKLRGICVAAGTGNIPVGPNVKPEGKYPAGAVPKCINYKPWLSEKNRHFCNTRVEI